MAALSSASPPPIVVFHGNVVKSDTAVTIELKHSLREAATKFRDAILEKLKDWDHEGKVLNLVHPSL